MKQMKGEYADSNMFSKLHHNRPYTRPSDGATIELPRRPRGRPRGSKNKYKQPLIITRHSEPAISPYILEIAGNSDIVDAVVKFCKRRNTAMSILTASGAVENVSLRQPASTPGETVMFHGQFDVLSLSATVFPAAALAGGFTISLAGPQGQIVGGAVVGPLVAAATVYVVAATFNNPSFHRLTSEEDVRSSVSGGGGGNNEDTAAAVSGGDDGGGEMSSMYSCHTHTPETVWALNARQPPPHYQ